MDAEKKIDELLASSGAQLIRQGKHLVYSLPTGGNFTMSKTPSDHRARLNEYTNLKHALGITKKQEAVVETEFSSIETPVVVKTKPVNSIQTRIAERITALDALRERLLQEASNADSQVAMLRKLEQFVDDPGMESVLRGLLKPERATGLGRIKSSKPRTKHLGPDFVSDHVAVTRELVFAATQTFGDGVHFDTGDIYRLMVGTQRVDTYEATRIRQTVGKLLNNLWERGQVTRIKQGVGRAHGVWTKVDATRLLGVKREVSGQ